MAAPLHTDYNILSELSLVTESQWNQKLSLALSFSYSWFSNRRRLEGHTYTIWNTVVSSFAAISPYLLNGPQFPIFVPSYDLDLGSSFQTIPDQGAQSGFPDFALLCLRCRPKRNTSLPVYTSLCRGTAFQMEDPDRLMLSRWDEQVITYCGIPVMFEIKKFPSRDFADVRFFKSALDEALTHAATELQEYAEILFNDPLRNEQNSVILVAGAGEWYIWRIMERDEVKIINRSEDGIQSDMDFTEDEAEEDSVADQEWWPRRKKLTKAELQVKKEQQRMSEDEERRRQLMLNEWRNMFAEGGDEPCPQRFADLLAAVVVSGPIDKVIPKKKLWSMPLRLGSHASNQRMWWIRSEIAKIVAARDQDYTKG